MRKLFKWLAGLGVGVVVLAVIAVIVIPRLVDVQRFKPELEGRIQEAFGRPVKLDGDVRLTVFPSPTLRLSEVHIKNPDGFEERDFVYANSFEARVKLLPLFRGEVQVLSLSLEKPLIILERNRDGLGNWRTGREKTEVHVPGYGLGHDLKGMMIERIAIDGGMIVFIDQASGMRRKISDVNLDLKDVSLDRPFDIALSAKVEGKPEALPVSLKGNVGPLGSETGGGIMPFDLTFRGPEGLELSVKGNLANSGADPRFDMVVRLSSFSPRKVLSALGWTDLVPPPALDKMAFDTHITGDAEVLTLADGKLDLDDSHAVFSAVIKLASTTDVAFTVKLDGIDLDRYPPPSGAEGPGTRHPSGDSGTVEASGAKASRDTDYSPPARVDLSGEVEIGALKVRGVQTRDVRLSILGENGVYKIDPLDLKLYEGAVSGSATVDMRREVPVSDISFRADGIKTAPLLGDLIKKEPLTGTMRARADLHMEGSRGERIEKTLRGKGEIELRDGAIRGVSIWGLAKTADPVLGLVNKELPSSQTEFSRIYFPFTLNEGNIVTKNATMASSNLTASASGSADFISRTLNFRIEPKVAAPLKSMGISRVRSPEITVPVLVRGTFSSPEFVPDVRGIVQETVKDEVQKLYKQGQGGTGSLGERARGLIRIPGF